MKLKSYEYHNAAYQHLLQTVVPLRQAFRAEKTKEGREQIADAELKGWKDYLAARKTDIAEKEELADWRIDEKNLSLLKD